MEAQGLSLPNFPYMHDTHNSSTGLHGDPKGSAASLAVAETSGVTV